MWGARARIAGCSSRLRPRLRTPLPRCRGSRWWAHDAQGAVVSGAASCGMHAEAVRVLCVSWVSTLWSESDESPMTATETTRELMAVPYDPTVNQAAKLEKILTNLSQHPHWYSAPSTEWERAIAASIIIHDPYNKVWEVWKGSDLVGLLLL